MFEDISINLAASVIYDFGKAIVHAANKTEAVQLARKQLGTGKALHDFPDRYVEALVELRFEQKPLVVLDFFRTEEIMAAFYAYYYGPVESRGDDKKHQIALNRCTTFLKQKYPHTPTDIDISAEIEHFWQVFRQKVQESRTVKEVEIHLKLEELTAAYTDMATAWQELQAWLVQKNAEQIEVGGQIFSVGSEQAQEVLRAEVERAISIVNSNNVVVNSTISANTVNIGDTHHHYDKDKSNKSVWLKIGAALVTIIGLLAGIADFTGVSLMDLLGKEKDPPAEILQTPTPLEQETQQEQSPADATEPPKQPPSVSAPKGTPRNHFESRDSSKQINIPDNNGTININQ